MSFELPKLTFSYDSLEPYIDTKTMDIHYSKHHQGYVNKLNIALEDHATLQKFSLDKLLKDIKTLPKNVQTEISNNGGGHANHSLFWSIMKPQGGGEPVGMVAEKIKKTFGSFESLQERFNNNAKTVFGSGWSWLCVDKDYELQLISSVNQDSPLMQGLTPILGLDVWEHAYYLMYQNRRPDYINAWWHVVDWDMVEENYRLAIK
jgi:Fe-Mn family superoxide dismutase